MKVYNKRKLLLSALWIIVAISIIAISLVQGDLEFKGIFAAICCAILGINGLGRSISKKMSLEDKVEELDERNQLIELKSKRKAFQIIQYTLLITGFVFACLGGSYKSVLLGAVGVTSAGMWTLSLLLDWLTYTYYELKN